ncbi:MAG: DUF1178 family protein [Comamonas sp.]|uniref:DUF1178 family protein n=1 Tax=Comamonas sp. lk TaxID=2201272 RepID=UPI000EAD50A3|nr:DUF1178 family protein [Comamonas sp. lk]
MKVLDLHCSAGHVFEGWFGSEDDFQSQLARKLVQCPSCGDSHIVKRLSAPRLNLGAQQPPPAAPVTERHPAQPSASPVPAKSPAPELTAQAREQLHAMHSAWVQWSRKVAENTEDVGKNFAQEARRMHYGETDERAIRGQTSPEQAMELMEEGIGVMPLALPETGEGGSGTLQ